MAKSDNFKPILDFLKKLDFFVGNLVFQNDANDKKTWKEKIIETVTKLTLPTFLLNGIILFISTMIVSQFSTISIIMSGSLLVAVIAVFYNALMVTFNKSQTKTFIEWCESLHNADQKFHPVVRSLAENHLCSMRSRVVKTLKYVRIVLYSNALLATFGYALVGSFLPESIYPKYSLPAPFLYPFKNQNTWFAFLMGVLGQTRLGFDGVTLALLAFGIIYCIVIHILTYLDIVKATVRMMKDQLEMKLVMEVESIQEDPDKIEVLDRKTLSDILQSIQAEAPDDDKSDPSKLTFDEWIKIIVDMITDLNDVLSHIINFCSKSFLLIEYGSLTSLFMSGMVILVIHQQYILAVGALWLPMVLFVICYANEMILSKFSEISEELYNLPWYALTLKEQKTFLVALDCDYIQGGFNAGTFHGLNNERFLQVLKLAYSNVLVLRDLAKM